MIKDARSALKSVESGVLQGSVIGSLLFVLYTSDLPDLLNSFYFLTPASDVAQLSNDLERVTRWCENGYFFSI